MSTDIPVAGPQEPRVRLRPETYPKWLAITKARRWTLSEAADALADEFLQRHDITVTREPTAESHQAEGETTEPPSIRGNSTDPGPDGSVAHSPATSAASSTSQESSSPPPLPAKAD